MIGTGVNGSLMEYLGESGDEQAARDDEQDVDGDPGGRLPRAGDRLRESGHDSSSVRWAMCSRPDCRCKLRRRLASRRHVVLPRAHRVAHGVVAGGHGPPRATGGRVAAAGRPGVLRPAPAGGRSGGRATSWSWRRCVRTRARPSTRTTRSARCWSPRRCRPSPRRSTRSGSSARATPCGGRGARSDRGHPRQVPGRGGGGGQPGGEPGHRPHPQPARAHLPAGARGTSPG